MTTILGIKTYKGEKGVVLASDVSKTSTSWTPQGDLAYRKQTKSEVQKIRVDNKREFVVCMVGVYDQHYINFLNRTLDNEINVKDAIKKGSLEELLKLNLERWEYRDYQPEYVNGLLLATRFDGEPKLYTCWPLGKVEERPWTAIGSGSGYAIEHINKQDLDIPFISLEEGIDLAVSSLDKAAQDIYTGGLDLVVLTADKIKTFGNEIKKDIKQAKAQSIQKIKDSLHK